MHFDTSTSDTVTIQAIEAAWNSAAGPLADWVLAHLCVRNDSWGAINPLAIREVINPETHKPYGKTCTITPKAGRGVLGRGTLIRHFRATCPEHVLGLLTISTDDTCSGIALDIDAHKLDEGRPEIAERNLRFVLHVRDELHQYGMECLIVDSNAKGGYHLRVIFTERIASDLAYRFGQWLLRDWKEFGFWEQPESFPKATSHKTKRGGICGGGWIRLFGRHHTRDTWSTVFNGVEFVSGQAAINTILSTTGCDSSLIPQAARDYKTPREIKEEENQVRAEAARREFESREKTPVAGTVKPYDVARRMCDTSPGWVDRPTGQSGRENACFSLMCWIVRGTGLSADEVVSVVDSNWNHKACTMDGDLIPFSLAELQKKAADATSAVMTSGGPTLDNLRSAEEWAQKQTQRRTVPESATATSTGGIDPKSWTDNATSTHEHFDSRPERLSELESLLVLENQGDAKLSQRFAKMYGDRLKYIPERGTFIWWTGTRWHSDATHQEVELAKQFSAEICRECRKLEAQSNGDGTKTKSMKELACKVASKRFIFDVLALAKSDEKLLLSTDQLDSRPYLFNVKNGTVDLRTKQLVPHDRSHYITKLCNLEYNPGALCPAWESFVFQIMGNDLSLWHFLQRFVGYTITGEVREHKFAIFFGSGGNGKSVFISLILQVLGGDYGYQSPPSLLLEKSRDEHPTIVAALEGKRFVACSETGDSSRFNEPLLKQLTGGDRLTARKMYQDFWEFDPSHKLVLLTNHKPHVRGTDPGVWRRILLIPFTQRFWDESTGETGPPELKQDPLLPKKLFDEAEGILNWMVEGAHQWYSGGLEIPPVVKAATAEYRNSEDILQQFLDERCLFGPVYRVKAATLYKTYKQWAEQNGEHPKTQTKFGSIIGERFEREKSSSKVYLGIDVRNDWDE